MGRYYVQPFNMGRGGNQGYPVYPTVCKIVINAVIRTLIIEVCGPQEAQHMMGWEVGKHAIVFYTDDGRIKGRNPI